MEWNGIECNVMQCNVYMFVCSFVRSFVRLHACMHAWMDGCMYVLYIYDCCTAIMFVQAEKLAAFMFNVMGLPLFSDTAGANEQMNNELHSVKKHLMSTY